LAGGLQLPPAERTAEVDKAASPYRPSVSINAGSVCGAVIEFANDAYYPRAAT
jgi:hypothetical protein